MKGYTKCVIRAAGVMPNDRIRIGDEVMKIVEYKQLTLTDSIMLTLVDEAKAQRTVLLTLDNSRIVTVYTKK